MSKTRKSTNKKNSKNNARLVALYEINAVFDNDQALGQPVKGRNQLEARDAAFSRRLAYGVVRWYSALDWLAGELLDRPMKSRDSDVQRLVLMGIYQLWKEDTSSHAAVHATAECARSLGKPWAVGLINAVLRRFQREEESLLAGLAKVDEQYAHPDWLLAEMKSDWPEQWQEIANANNTPAGLWVRCNPGRASVQQIRDRLEEAEFITSVHPDVPHALEIKPAASVDRLPGFADGWFSVQDPAAQLAATLADPQAGEKILDACAAPGGKTGHLLELQGEIDLLALDLYEGRTALVAENMERLGLKPTLKTADAGQSADWWDGEQFHRILLDAPCSATGVIRRHPEIKWLRTPEQVDEVISTQQTLLQQLWPLLHAGGILVYATCSVLKRENSQQIHEFLDKHSDAECIGPESIPGLKMEFGQQILPGAQDMDGFYYAVLRKSA